VQIYEPGPDEPPVPPDDGGDTIPPGDGDNGGTIIIDNWPPDGPGHVKYVVDDVPVYVVAERVQYYGKDGKLITESLKDYTRHRIADRYASLDDFLHHWSDAGQKRAIVHELEEQGVLLDALANQVGRGYDPFDLVCHVAFGRPPLTRRERAAQVRKRDYFTRYGDQARAVLDALLDKYADEGIESIEALDILRVQPFDRFGTPVEIIQRFGGKAQYLRALRELESQLYLAA